MQKTLRMGCVLERERALFSLTSVGDSGDGISIEHSVEEGVGVFRELRDDRESEESRIYHKPQYNTHTHKMQ